MVVCWTDMQVEFYFTETGSIAITRWFAPEGKKPSHFPAKSSFPFFGVEPYLIEEKVCNFAYLDSKWKNRCTHFPNWEQEYVQVRDTF